MKKYINKLNLTALVLLTGLLISAQTPALEFGKINGDGNPTGDGIEYETTITLLKNTDNPTGNTFVTHSPPVTATFEIINDELHQQYYAAYFGVFHNNYTGLFSSPVYPELGFAGNPQNSWFTSHDANAGTGIDVNSNHGVEIMLRTDLIQDLNPKPKDGVFHFADLKITFSEPVNNPIMHIAGMGDDIFKSNSRGNSWLGYSVQFLLAEANVDVNNITLSKLSGSSAFEVWDDYKQIMNVGNWFGPENDGESGSGSVKFEAEGVTELVLAMFIMGDGGGKSSSWLAPSIPNWGDTYGDYFTIGFSLPLSEQENCDANTAPVVDNDALSNECPVETVDLADAFDSLSIPSGLQLHWFTNNTHTGTPLTSGEIEDAEEGTYYAFFYDPVNQCYGQPSDPVTVTPEDCTTCTDSGIEYINLNDAFEENLPDENVVLEWWTTPDRQEGTKVVDPSYVTESGDYYAFFHDTENGCYNTDYSTAAVNVKILPPCESCLEAKVLLQGALIQVTDVNNYVSNNIMRDDLRTGNLLPLTQPYGDILEYTGSEEITDQSVFNDYGEDSIVDWVLLELRDAVNPSVIVERKAALVQRNGNIVDIDGVSCIKLGIQTGEYYLAVRHRNHLGVMSKDPLDFSQTVIFDFTADELYQETGRIEDPAFTRNGYQMLWAGDANADGKIRLSATDSDSGEIETFILNLPENNLGSIAFPHSAYSAYDLNMNGEVRYSATRSDNDLIYVNINVNANGNTLGADSYTNFYDNLPD